MHNRRGNVRVTDGSGQRFSTAKLQKALQTFGTAMTCTNRSLFDKHAKAFTLIELLVVIFTTVMLVVLVFSGMARAKRESLQKVCANNLKQVGLAYRLWSSRGSFPMGTTNYGGTLEFINTGETFRHLQIISNELMTPNVLACPADIRRPAESFIFGFSNTNISYFVGVDADEAQPEMLLSGDRNITNGLSPTNGMLILTTNRTTEWARAMHKFAGNVGLADGSVQHTNSLGLRKLIANTGVATNRIAFP